MLLASALAFVPSLIPQEPVASVTVAPGPRVLSAGIELQWGGHAFSYLLEGKDALFWSGLAYRSEDEVSAAVVGQAPKEGTLADPVVTVLSIAAEDLQRVFQPQMVRTPDGFLHVFVGYVAGLGAHGRVAYFRSERAEDASSFVDRSELVPMGAYAGFHNRQNVALGPRGDRMVLAVLSSFAPGVHPINIPLLLVGHREGLDFRFSDPVAYGDAEAFFYPLIAATRDGIVLAGSLSDDAGLRRDTQLVHLDWAGTRLFASTLPAPAANGFYAPHALQPNDPRDWSRLTLARTLVSDEDDVRTIEFWEYDVAGRALHLVRSLANDTANEPSITNAGELIPRADREALFVNNPASGSLAVWEQPLAAIGPHALLRLPATEPGSLGYPRSRSVFAPNVLQGSIVPRDGTYLAVDMTSPGISEELRGPCSFLLWRLRWVD